MDRHQKARIALRKSIKHWCVDILRLLKKGAQINSVDLTWVHNGKHVPSGSKYCELCRRYSECYSRDFLEYAIDYNFDVTEFSADRFDSFDYICPLFITQNDACGGDNTAWAGFMDRPNLESAEMMVKILVKCYNEYV